MKNINDFIGEKMNFKMQSAIIGGDTWNECHEDTYAGCGDDYVQVTDDNGQHLVSYTLEKDCPDT